MEIPYIVEPRKDTGLFNAKIAIWLFLASEVMLFGGLFSAYIFLRLGADFPWPERALPILPGLVNTAILIFSSVTVVFAWAELKLRNWRKFQIYMSITILCAVAFMAIKLPGEYNAKFNHQAIRTSDFSILEGHVLKPKEYDGETKHVDSLGNYLRVATTAVDTYQSEGQDKADSVEGFVLEASVRSFYAPYYATIFEQLKKQEFETFLYLGKNKDQFVEIGGKRYDNNTPLTIEVLEEFQSFFVETRTTNNNLNADLLRQAWSQFRKEREQGLHPEFENVRDAQAVSAVKVIQKELMAARQSEYLNLPENFTDENQIALPETVRFILQGSGYLKFVPAKGTFGGGTKFLSKGKDVTILHKDKTRIVGVQSDKVQSGIEIAIDQIDLGHFVMKWQNDDKDGKLPLSAYIGSVDEETGVYTPPTETISIFDESLAIDYYKDSNEIKHLQDRIAQGTTLNKVWETHMKWLHYRTKELAEKGLEPTEAEMFVVIWQQLVGYGLVDYKMESQADFDAYNAVAPQWYSSWFGPEHGKKDIEKYFPYAFVPREEIRLESNLTPKWSNYYAIYFTITGLHGLHVIGGALVLGYYLFFGRKMYDSNPEWLANRVEVGGLFWHFVDLVWIFAFPIFYLM